MASACGPGKWGISTGVGRRGVIGAEAIRATEAVIPWVVGEISAARGAAGFEDQLRLL